MVRLGHTVALPEIVDYELRREMLRLRSLTSIENLDTLAERSDYLRITTAVMHQAAEFWRCPGSVAWPTAADKAIDCDMILVAQAVLHAASQREVRHCDLKC